MADAQREAVVQAVDTQREAVLAELRAEPITLRHDVEPLIMSALDRAFARLFVLLGISYVVLVATAFFWHRLTRHRRRMTDAAPPRGQM